MYGECMMYGVLLLAVVGGVAGSLWPQGIVHYAINKKDYDVHSQDIIISTFSAMQREICIKFFGSPGNYSASPDTKILYISNPDKLKDCPPRQYSFHGGIVDLPIGYRCLDQQNISRIVMDMLKASVQQTAKAINSFDLTKKFRQWIDAEDRPTLITPADRNYINVNYLTECSALGRAGTRRLGDEVPLKSEESDLAFYKDKLWPLGVLMYAVHPNIEADDPDLLKVQRAMSAIERHSCVVFQPLPPRDQLEPKSFLWLSREGEPLPALGFRQGNQSVNLQSLAVGAPGHTAHTLHALLRALGLPMMSNRYDRDNYLRIEWKNVQPGMEHYLERLPAAAWLRQVPYDAGSATHAPANYMCARCDQPARALTVLPHQDHLWQQTLSMGHVTELSETDKTTLDILYGKECQARSFKSKK